MALTKEDMAVLWGLQRVTRPGHVCSAESKAREQDLQRSSLSSCSLVAFCSALPIIG